MVTSDPRRPEKLEGSRSRLLVVIALFIALLALADAPLLAEEVPGKGPSDANTLWVLETQDEADKPKLKPLLRADHATALSSLSLQTSPDPAQPPISDPVAGSATFVPLISMPMGMPETQPTTERLRTRFAMSQFTTLPVAGDVPNTFRYNGRADAYIDVGGSVFGLDESWTLTVRPELTWGENANSQIGLIPSNTAAFRPAGKGDFDVSVSLRKRWDSGVSLTFGKINTLDIAGELPIVGSDAHKGFQNLGLALPPTAIIPNTLTGAMLEVPADGWLLRAWVFDPDSQFERTGFETAFESGVAGLLAATRITRIGSKPGFYSVGLAASTRSSPNTELLPLPLPPSGAFGNEQNELALSASAYQFVSLYPEAPGKGWGLLARFQVSQGDPTFLDWSGYFGISGNPRFRPQDRFGVAWFRYSITDELVDDVAFFLDLEDEEGVEAFYTLEFAKGFQITASAQIVDGGVATADTGVILGARLTASF